MHALKLRCETYTDSSVMDINIKIAEEGVISQELTDLFYEEHKEDIDEIQRLYKAETENVKRRVSIFNKLKEEEMIYFTKLVTETHPELFI